MTIEPNVMSTPGEKPQQAADRIANSLRKIETQTNDRPYQRGKFHALLTETYSLLSGIRMGYVESSQPRIAKNLIEMYEILCSNEKQQTTDKSEDVASHVLMLLADACGGGLTAEQGVPFAPRRSVNR